MSLASIIGQPLAVDLCRTWLKRQTTNPLLFHGPDGVGKRTLALEVAKALNCKAEPASGRTGEPAIQKDVSPIHRFADSPIRGGCDVCSSCRRINEGHHPDVRVINLEYQAAERA